MPTTRRDPTSALRRAILSAALIAVFAITAPAQSPFGGTTPVGVAPGSPTGAYALSDFENVSLYSGGLNVALPLLKVGGRGSAQYTMMLRPVRTNWVVQHQPASFGTSFNYPSNEWWAGIGAGYSAGVLVGRRAGAVPCDTTTQVETLTRLTFTAADGTEYELRDQVYGGAAMWTPCRDDGAPAFNRGKVFATADGTSATFISDTDIRDYTWGGSQFFPSGYLMLRDGTRYRIAGGGVTWMRDRNGNQLTFTYDSIGRLVKVIDSLNREVEIAEDVNDGPPYGHCDRITYRGFGGGTRVIRVSEAPMSTSMRDGETIQQYYELFPETFGGWTYGYYDDSRVTAVWLPDGRSYKFLYNSYGEIARIVLPTGAAIEYDYGPGVNYDGRPNGLVDMGWMNDDGPGSMGYMAQTIVRRVYERRVYPDGGSGASFSLRTSYAAAEDQCNFGLGSVEVINFKADGTPYGTRLGGERHWFYGSPCGSMRTGALYPAQYPSWKDGREYKTESLAADGQTVLRRVEMTWQQPAAGATWPLTQQETNNAAKTNNPQITQTVTTLLDTNQVSKQTFAYDQYNNQTDVYEYDFGASPGVAGALARRSHTDFVTTAVYVNANINPGSGAHLRNLPSQTWVSPDANGVNKESLTTFAYDQFGLTDRPNITGMCATFPNAQCASAGATAYVTRGNVTSVTRYANASVGTGALTATSYYDIAGNVVSTTDPKGYTAQISYADSFCNGPACGGTFTPNTYAFATTKTSPAPDVSATLGYTVGTFGATYALTSSTVYDYYTGLVQSVIDANAKTTTFEYVDDLDRLTAVIRPAGGGRTDYDYSEPAEPQLYVRTLTDLDATRRTETKQYFDRLGRPYRSLNYENQDPTHPWITTDTEYDALGRVARTSLPYRSAGGATRLTPGEWAATRRSETEYDALGRIRTVTSWPDAAAVKTDYSGNRVLVTDQDGKQVVSRTDALGRPIQVWEVRPSDPASGTEALSFPSRPGVPAPAAGYRTDYAYDSLLHLRTVTQGAQTRTFVYDSLGRLTSVTNPESGTLSYTYDANGNVQTKTDARGVTATHTYDRLNRNIIVTYAGGGTTTPDVNRHYDGAVNGKGRPHWTHTPGVAASVFDAYDASGRPTQYRQAFWVNNAWQNFNVGRTYDRAGNVLTQTYPSGHTVTYNYDASGRPGDNGAQVALSGNVGDGVQRNYSAGVSYSEYGGLREERFGTSTPLYRKIHYNTRGQLFDLRLSTYSLQASEWDWNRGAFINYYSTNYEWAGHPGTSGSAPDNNGNLRRAEIFVPHNEQTTVFTAFRQNYAYDSLNRLASVEEVYFTDWSGQTTPGHAQAYDYDRYGNRTVNAAGTWVGSPSAPPSPLVPETQFEQDAANPAYREVSAPSNRLYAPGDGGRMPGQKWMGYDAAGNLTRDAYTGHGSRVYDAENRMTSAQDVYQNWSQYTYDADGRRVKRGNVYGETWQVFGVGGELLAEYQAGAAPFIPTKEYAYRGGELLFTATSGDPGRMTRFIKNLYYNALARDPSAGEMQQQTATLTSAGVQGQPQLLTTSRAMARAIFESAEYAARGRTDSQYVTDLYNSYLQRGPDQGGLNYWVGGVQANGRGAVLNAFEVCMEFERLVQTLYGIHHGGDNQRVEHFVRTFYQGARRTEPTGAEMQQQTQRLNNAAAQGESQAVAEAQAMGLEVFQATNYNSGRTDQEYVTDLYQAFLQRAPDAGGLNYWVGGVQANGRAAVLSAFQASSEFCNLARTLYRETFWLVTDHLGTPRLVVSKTGSLAGVKRHDYLPFGDELYANTGGRTVQQGYGASDNVRQKFTGFERDAETSLDYAQARYFAKALGRFTSGDPFNIVLETKALAGVSPEKAQTQFVGYLSHPAKWNRYAYVVNNPLKYVDPTGEDLELTGETSAERAEALRRIQAMVDPSARNLLYIQAVRSKGKMRYYVKYRGDFASKGPLEAGVARVINDRTTTEYKIAESFTPKDSKESYSVAAHGGGVTLPRHVTATGNVQIFVHPNAGAVFTEAITRDGLLLRMSDDGKPYVQTNENSDAHEFGHAYAEVLLCYGGDPKKNTFSRDMSLEFENYTRRRHGLNQRKRH